MKRVFAVLLACFGLCFVSSQAIADDLPDAGTPEAAAAAGVSFISTFSNTASQDISINNQSIKGNWAVEYASYNGKSCKIMLKKNLIVNIYGWEVTSLPCK